MKKLFIAFVLLNLSLVYAVEFTGFMGLPFGATKQEAMMYYSELGFSVTTNKYNNLEISKEDFRINGLPIAKNTVAIGITDNKFTFVNYVFVAENYDKAADVIKLMFDIVLKYKLTPVVQDLDNFRAIFAAENGNTFNLYTEKFDETLLFVFTYSQKK